MEIFVKTGAVDRYQMDKEVAKPVALETIHKQYKHEHNKATDPWFRGRIDVNEAAKNAKLFRKNYERVLPETLSSNAKDTMWRRAKQLKDEFIVGMLSHEELHPVRAFVKDGTTVWVVDEGKMNSMNCVPRNTAWNQKNAAKVREFKNIMRHLCPEDPNAGDIEKFRPRLKNIH